MTGLVIVGVLLWLAFALFFWALVRAGDDAR